MADRIRLTPDGRFGNACARRDDTGAFVTYEIDDGYGVATLTDAEALAFARQLPEIREREKQDQALLETMKEIAGGSCCQWPGCCIDVPMCTAMTARAAVARFKGDL